MLRAAWLALVLVSACTSDVGQSEAASPTCEPAKDELLGCCAAGASCTWTAPIGEFCTDEFTSFCGRGLGWCEDSVCRSFCSPVSSPRCPDGTVEHHAPIPDLGDADQCLCVPD